MFNWFKMYEGKKMELCNKEGCKNEAHWNPGFLLYAPADYKSHPIQTALGLKICDSHKETMVLSDVMTDAGWKSIMAGLKKLGTMRVEPERALTKLFFWELGEAPLRQDGGM